MTKKEFITPNDLYKDSFKLGKMIYNSGYKPDTLIAVWRGGTPIACCVEEYFRTKGLHTEHYPIKTSAYEQSKIKREIRVECLEEVSKRTNKNSKLLIIDDVFDTGKSIDKVIEELKILKGNKFPNEVKIATLYFKPDKNETKRTPNFYLHKKTKIYGLFFLMS